MKGIQPGSKWQECWKLCEEVVTFSKGDKKPLNACKLGIYIIVFAFLEDSSGCRVETGLEQDRSRCRRNSKQALSFIQARDVSLGWSWQRGWQIKGEVSIGRSYEIWGRAGQRRVWEKEESLGWTPALKVEPPFIEIRSQGSQRSSYLQTSGRTRCF